MRNTINLRNIYYPKEEFASSTIEQKLVLKSLNLGGLQKRDAQLCCLSAQYLNRLKKHQIILKIRAISFRTWELT